MTKTSKNWIVALLAVILTFSIALLGVCDLKSARAEEDEPIVAIENKMVKIEFTADYVLANKTICCRYGTVFNIYLNEEKTEWLNFQGDVGIIDYYLNGEVYGSPSYYGNANPDTLETIFSLDESLEILPYVGGESIILDLTRPVYYDGNALLFELQPVTHLLSQIKEGDVICGKTLFFANTTYCCDPSLSMVSLTTYTIVFDEFEEGGEVISIINELTGDRYYIYTADTIYPKIEVDCSGGHSCWWNGLPIPEDGMIVAYTPNQDEVMLDLSDEIVFQTFDNKNIIYIASELEPEEPIEPPVVPEEPEVPDEPSDDGAGQTPDVPKDDNVKDDASKDDNKNDVVDEEKVTFKDWVKENSSLLIALGAFLAVMLVTAVALKKKRR